MPDLNFLLAWSVHSVELLIALLQNITLPDRGVYQTKILLALLIDFFVLSLAAVGQCVSQIGLAMNYSNWVEAERGG
jgi:hypothetical protein